MDESDRPQGAAGPESRGRTYLAVAGYGAVLFGVFSAGSAFELTVTNGVCWVYLMSYFMAFVVTLAVRRVGRFGTGIAVFLPYAIPGFFIEYYLEYVLNPNLIAPWAAAMWAGNGLVAGLVADLSQRWLPKSLGGARRAIVCGVATVVTYWALTLLTLAFLYVNPAPGVAHFLNGIAFTLPWLVVSGAFGGYTAYTLSRTRASRPGILVPVATASRP